MNECHTDITAKVTTAQQQYCIIVLVHTSLKSAP